MVVSQAKQSLEDYFDKNYELEQILEKKWKLTQLEAIREPQRLANITFVRQFEQKWTWHAILQAAPRVGNDDAMVVYGDSIYHPWIFSWIMDVYNQKKWSVMALTEVPYEDVSKYGVAQIQDWRITDYIEKPKPEEAPSNLISYSPYIVPPRFFEDVATTQADAQSWEIYPRPALKNVMVNDNVYPFISDLPIRDTWNIDSRMQANAAYKDIEASFL